MLPTKLDSRKAKAHRYACHLARGLTHFDAYRKRVADGKCAPRVRETMKARAQAKAYLRFDQKAEASIVDKQERKSSPRPSPALSRLKAKLGPLTLLDL